MRLETFSHSPPSFSVAVNPNSPGLLTYFRSLARSHWAFCFPGQDAIVDLAAAPPRLPELPSLILYTLQSASLKGWAPAEGNLARCHRPCLFVFKRRGKCREKRFQYLNSSRDVESPMGGRDGDEEVGRKLHQQAYQTQAFLISQFVACLLNSSPRIA